jgi:serine/threonine protein kinase
VEVTAVPADPERVQAVFLAAAEADNAADRAAVVDRLCGADDELRHRVETLLRAHDAPGSFLECTTRDPVATVDQPPPAERLGTTIGPYKLLEQIGEGGMGAVWMAQQTEPVKRLVAVKLIKAGMDSRQVIARFEAERQALALMDHANIARVLDAGTTAAGRPYFVMDLVRGVPITKYCDEHRLTPRQRLELFLPICQAIQHAHQKGVIHRDLKPTNVLVALYDGRPVPKVIDFGVAKATGQALTEKTLVTGFGNIVGTLEYMSPEQAEINQLDIDTRSDIYSLGVLLYELLAGSTPFSRKKLEKAGMLEMLRVIREVEPTRPSAKLSTADGLPTLAANRGTEPAQLTRLVRGELDWIVMKALEKDRSRRYETANGFALDIQRYLADEPVAAGPPSATYRLRKFVRRYRKPLAALGAMAVLMALGTVISIGFASWAIRERDNADSQKRLEEASLKRALEVVDTMLTRVAEDRLANVPQMEPVRRKILKDALRFYQEFLQDRVHNPAVRLEVARAYKRVGQIQILLGQRDDGEAAYQQALILLEQLHGESPADPNLQNELGETFDALGTHYHSIQRWPQSEAALRRGAAILDQRASEQPIPVKNRLTLAGIHNNLLVHYRRTGDLGKAEAAFLECKTLVESVLAGDSNHAKALSVLANSENNMGFVYGAKSKTNEAEAAFLKAMDHFKRLIRDDPDNVLLRKQMARAHHNLADHYSRNRQDAKADVAFQDSLAQHEAIHRDHPQVVTYTVEVGLSYVAIATHARKSRSAEESLEWSAKAISTLEPVLKKDPRDGYARFSLFSAVLGRGLALQDLRRHEDAAKDWRRVVELTEGQPDIRMRIYRPASLARLGEHAQATSEVETLLSQGHVQGSYLSIFAGVNSLSAGAAANDNRLAPHERARLADQYGGRAVELLRKAQAAGLFQDPGQLARLTKPEFDSISSRPDFRGFVDEVEKKASKGPKEK